MALQYNQIIWTQTQAQTWLCIVCAYNAQGVLKANGAFQTMGDFNRAQHEACRGHMARLAAGRGPAQPPYVVRGNPVVTNRGCCTACCIDSAGHTRHDYSSMEAPTVVTHLASPEHQRRVGENRLAAYRAIHGLGPHQRLGADEW